MEDQSKILELYITSVNEEHYFLTEHQKRVAFYVGLVSAIFTLTVGGFLKATEWYQFVALGLVGGILIMEMSKVAKSGTQRMYQRFLETVTTRAKLEHDLGLSQGRRQSGMGWVHKEPYSPGRHLESRSNDQWKTSRAWVDAHLDMKENYHGVSRTLFSIAWWVGIILIVMAFLFAYIKYN